MRVAGDRAAALRGRVEVGAELGEGLELAKAAPGSRRRPPATFVFMRLRLGRATHARDRDAGVRRPAGREDSSGRVCEVDLAVGDRDDVGRM